MCTECARLASENERLKLAIQAATDKMNRTSRPGDGSAEHTAGAAELSRAMGDLEDLTMDIVKHRKDCRE